jgi:hypothetical protein
MRLGVEQDVIELTWRCRLDQALANVLVTHEIGDAPQELQMLSGGGRRTNDQEEKPYRFTVDRVERDWGWADTAD